MADAPFPTNHPAHVVDEVIDGVFGVGVQLAETAIKAELPIFAVPVIGPVVSFLLDRAIYYLADKIYQQFALMVSFAIIDYQVSGEVSDSKKALIALRAAQLSGDPNARKIALDNFRKATVALTRFDGASPPGHL